MTRDNRQQLQEPGLLIPAVLVVLAVIAAGIYFWAGGRKGPEMFEEKPPVISSDDSKMQGKIEIPQIEYPVPQEGGKAEGVITQPEHEAEPLPFLDESDAFIEEEFRHLYDEQKFGSLFILKNIIRNIVVTIDNMTGPKLPQKFSLLKPPVGRFQAEKDATGSEFIDHRNYGRYIPFVDLAEAVDIRRFMSFYVRYYALFQQAYRELGYPDRYFNDRFVQVLDHLLAAPEVHDPVKLVRPKVFYQYADPGLEALSAGQKIMVRIGPDNAARVKARIRELRQALTSLKKKK
jgi:hypothetical protein